MIKSNCEICGKEFEKTCWNKKYCDVCGSDKEVARRFRLKHPEKNKLKKDKEGLFIINCQRCNLEIHTKANNKKYCGKCAVEKRKEDANGSDGYLAKYRKTQKYRDKQARFEATPKRIKYLKEFTKSDHGKKLAYERKKKWFKTEKGKKTIHKINNRWTQSEKGKVSLIKRHTRRRKNINKVIEDFTPEQWNKKLLKTKGFCPICKEYFGINNLSLDHTIPISEVYDGFVYTIHDVEPMCLECNIRKRNKVPTIYLPYKQEAEC